MRCLVDGNVILDVLLKREPHIVMSSRVWRAIEEHRVAGALSAHVVTTIYYMLRKDRGNLIAQSDITMLMRVFRVAVVDGLVIERALSLGWTDFEDAVNAAAAERADCDIIVTRGRVGYPHSRIPVHTPESAMALLPKQ